MKCPHCKAEAPEAAPECASCGLIFSKWREPAAKAQALAEVKNAAPKPVLKPLAAAALSFIIPGSGHWLYGFGGTGTAFFLGTPLMTIILSALLSGWMSAAQARNNMDLYFTLAGIHNHDGWIYWILAALVAADAFRRGRKAPEAEEPEPPAAPAAAASAVSSSIPGAAPAPAKAKPAGVGKLTRWWVIVGCIAAFDDFLMCQGIMAMVATIPVMVALLPGTIMSAFRAPRPAPARAAAAGLGVLLVLSLLAFMPANISLAKHRAQELVTACYKYKAGHGEFPEKLQDLVPEFIPKVPRAKYTARNGNFNYRRGNLMWVSMEPFGRSYYDFDREKWGFYD